VPISQPVLSQSWHSQTYPGNFPVLLCSREDSKFVFRPILLKNFPQTRVHGLISVGYH